MKFDFLTQYTSAFPKESNGNVSPKLLNEVWIRFLNTDFNQNVYEIKLDFIIKLQLHYNNRDNDSLSSFTSKLIESNYFFSQPFAIG